MHPSDALIYPVRLKILMMMDNDLADEVVHEVLLNLK